MTSRGMENGGALCYMIAPLQQLLSMVLADATSTHDEAATSGTVLPFVRRWQTNTSSDSDPNFATDLWQTLYGDKGGDIFTQSDASEFYADFVAKLCNDAKALRIEETVARKLVGQLANVFEEKDCSDLSHRVVKMERFFHISVSVNPLDGNNCLQSALADFTRVEQIPFRWPVSSNGADSAGAAATTTTTAGAPRQLGPPVPSTKTTKFVSLPGRLAFHLRRFRFDTKAMQKVKLHHRFEFPALLDMRPYMLAQGSAYTASGDGGTEAGDGAPAVAGLGVSTQPGWAQNTVYRLCGVVVHRGRTAYEGHYYSIIRDSSSTATMPSARTGRREVTEEEGTAASAPSEDLGTALRGQRWRRYDDALVSEVAVQRLARETFGGDWPASSDDKDSEGDASEAEGKREDRRRGSDVVGAGMGCMLEPGATVAENRQEPAEEARVDTGPDPHSAAIPSEDSESEEPANISDPSSVRSSCSDDGRSDEEEEERAGSAGSGESDDDDSSGSSSYDSDDSSSEDNDEDYCSAFMLFYERVE